VCFEGLLVFSICVSAVAEHQLSCMEGNFRDKDKHNNVCTNMPVGALLDD
jgi:hypothetical protein